MRNLCNVGDATCADHMSEIRVLLILLIFALKWLHMVSFYNSIEIELVIGIEMLHTALVLVRFDSDPIKIHWDSRVSAKWPSI